MNQCSVCLQPLSGDFETCGKSTCVTEYEKHQRMNDAANARRIKVTTPQNLCPGCNDVIGAAFQTCGKPDCVKMTKLAGRVLTGLGIGGTCVSPPVPYMAPSNILAQSGGVEVTQEEGYVAPEWASNLVSQPESGQLSADSRPFTTSLKVDPNRCSECGVPIPSGLDSCLKTSCLMLKQARLQEEAHAKRLKVTRCLFCQTQIGDRYDICDRQECVDKKMTVTRASAAYPTATGAEVRQPKDDFVMFRRSRFIKFLRDLADTCESREIDFDALSATFEDLLYRSDLGGITCADSE